MQTNDSSNQGKPDEFRVGDIVWCLISGKGEVSSITNNLQDCTYPVEVRFENGDGGGYTLDGKLYAAGNRTLFFSEPKIEASVTRPFVPTLVGKTVMVQYYDETWTVKPITITEETFEEVFAKDGSEFKSDLLAIYEISSENLLKP